MEQGCVRPDTPARPHADKRPPRRLATVARSGNGRRSIFGQAGLEASLDNYLRGLQGNPASLVLPDGVIAAMPLMEDWGIASRLASLQGYPGCFEGYVTDLARAWLDVHIFKPVPVLGEPIPVDWSSRSQPPSS